MAHNAGFLIWQEAPGLVGIRLGQAFHFIHPENGEVMREQLPQGATWFTDGTAPGDVHRQAQMVKQAIDTVETNYRFYGVKECWWG